MPPSRSAGMPAQKQEPAEAKGPCGEDGTGLQVALQSSAPFLSTASRICTCLLVCREAPLSTAALLTWLLGGPRS